MTDKPDIVERYMWTTTGMRPSTMTMGPTLFVKAHEADRQIERLALRAQTAERERDEAYERAAKVIETGEFCRYVEHAQEYCDCRPMAAAIRALAKGEKQQPQKTGD
jgi:hypothetical protein